MGVGVPNPTRGVEEVVEELMAVYFGAAVAMIIATVALGLGGLGIAALLSLITRPGARRAE